MIDNLSRLPYVSTKEKRCLIKAIVMGAIMAVGLGSASGSAWVSAFNFGEGKEGGFKPSFVELQKAIVTEQQGEVFVKKGGSVVERGICLKEEIKPSDIIRTGKASWVALQFPDGTVCRLGSRTIFTFDPLTRDMGVTRGVAVVHVPPHQGGAEIFTPAATAQMRGDTLVLQAEIVGGVSSTHFISLSPEGGATDGKIRIFLNGNPSISLPLEPAHAVIVPRNAISLGQIFHSEIDVRSFVSHSSIIKNLPESAKMEIGSVVKTQTLALNSGVAQRTGWEIQGNKLVAADTGGKVGNLKEGTERGMGKETSAPMEGKSRGKPSINLVGGTKGKEGPLSQPKVEPFMKPTMVDPVGLKSHPEVSRLGNGYRPDFKQASDKHPHPSGRR